PRPAPPGRSGRLVRARPRSSAIVRFPSSSPPVARAGAADASLDCVVGGSHGSAGGGTGHRPKGRFWRRGCGKGSRPKGRPGVVGRASDQPVAVGVGGGGGAGLDAEL